MKPGSLVTPPQAGNSPPDDRGAKSSKYSCSLQETAMETFHGLPGPEFDQPFMRQIDDSSRINGKNIIYSKLYQEPQIASNQLHSMAYQYPRLGNPYELLLTNSNMLQNDLFMGEQNEYFDFAYTWPQSYGPEISTPTGVVPGLTPEHLLNSLQQNCINEFVDLDHLDNAVLESPAALDQLNINNIPKVMDQASSDIPMTFKSTSGLVETASSKASFGTDSVGDGDCLKGNSSTTEGHPFDAPYAKLIYKALMEAPNHSMVLQDIYQWFIDNTGKGKSASTGWRNSIRHNLSMNAAFRKTSRKSNGDDSKRTSEWVLEPFAILEGVTPTTRYRKNGKKGYRAAGSVPTRMKSDRLLRVGGRKSQFRSQQLREVGQDMVHDQLHHTAPQHRTSPIIDHCNFSLHTPSHHQPFIGALSQQEFSVLDDLGQYANAKSGQTGKEGVDCMDEYRPHVNNNTYMWADSPYY